MRQLLGTMLATTVKSGEMVRRLVAANGGCSSGLDVRSKTTPDDVQTIIDRDVQESVVAVINYNL